MGEGREVSVRVEPFATSTCLRPVRRYYGSTTVPIKALPPSGRRGCVRSQEGQSHAADSTSYGPAATVI
jgi:hypothetical protein